MKAWRKQHVVKINHDDAEPEFVRIAGRQWKRTQQQFQTTPKATGLLKAVLSRFPTYVYEAKMKPNGAK